MTFTLTELYTIMGVLLPMLLAAYRYYQKFKKEIVDRDIKLAKNQKIIDAKQDQQQIELKKLYDDRLNIVINKQESRDKELTDKIMDLEHRLTNFSESFIQHSEKFIRVDMQIDDLQKDLSKLDNSVGAQLDKFANKLDKIYEILANKLK